MEFLLLDAGVSSEETVKVKKRKKRSSLMKSLIVAASAIQGMTFTPLSFGEGSSPGSEVRFAFFNYRDWQASGDRMKVYAPMAWFRSALSDTTEVEGGFVLDSTSGASPMYHDTLSGASGKGIHDRRAAEDISVTHYFENFSLSAGVSESSENDYDSIGGSIESRFWTSDHNTILSFGISGSSDNISSSNDATLDKHKASQGIGIGITQVIDQSSMIQSNVTFSGSHGFQSDPYKSLDLRPRVRDDVAWLTRYVRYFSDLDGSLHLDYRYYRDTWGIAAHSAEVSWYQSISDSWLLSPHIRYYSQEKAEFYNNQFPPDAPGDHFYSADERLSGFGSITTGLGVTRDIKSNISLSATVDFMEQRGAWKFGSPGSPGLQNLSALMFGIGFLVKF